MKLTVLIENTTARDDLTCEHGLSLYIEANGRKILFDAGQSGAFADNAERLGIDLRAVDACILSHGHYDHGGGLARFLTLNDHAVIHMSRHAFGQHWHGPDKYIGLDRRLLDCGRIVFVDGETDLGDGLTLHTALPCSWPVNSAGLTRLEDGQHIPEDFRHEMYLTVREESKVILLSGCSHRGILNIAEHFQPDVLIGGFHLIKMTDEGELTTIARRLCELPTTYFTGHCTGEIQFQVLKGVLGNHLHALRTGIHFTI